MRSDCEMSATMPGWRQRFSRLSQRLHGHVGLYHGPVGTEGALSMAQQWNRTVDGPSRRAEAKTAEFYLDIGCLR